MFFNIIFITGHSKGGPVGVGAGPCEGAEQVAQVGHGVRGSAAGGEEEVRKSLNLRGFIYLRTFLYLNVNICLVANKLRLFICSAIYY